MAKPVFPHNLLKLYYKNHSRNMPYYPSYQAFEDTVREADDKNNVIERIFKQTMKDYPAADPAFLAERTGFIEWDESKDNTWMGNVGRGMAGRGAELAGGIVEVLDTALQEAGVTDSDNIVGNFAQYLRDQDFNYEEWTSWEDVKKNPLSALAFAFEKGLVSLPDMVAAATALPVYAVARTGEIAQERAENDGRTQPTLADMPIAAATAIASAYAERFGVQKLIGLPPKMAKAIKDGVNPNLPKKAGLKALGAEAGKSVVLQAKIEGGQEALENIGSTAGTERGLRPEETLSAAAQGALVGGIFGGSISTVTKGAQMAAGKTQENQQARADEIKRQSDIHQSNVDLNQQAKDGLRTKIPFSSLASGMKVMVSRIDNMPARGTVQRNEENSNLYDIVDKDGQPLLTNLDPEQEYDGIELFSEEQEDIPQEELDAVEDEKYRNEITRLTDRLYQGASQSEFDALKKLRDNDRFADLDDDTKNLVDDTLADAEQELKSEDFAKRRKKGQKKRDKMFKKVEKINQERQQRVKELTEARQKRNEESSRLLEGPNVAGLLTHEQKRLEGPNIAGLLETDYEALPTDVNEAVDYVKSVRDEISETDKEIKSEQEFIDYIKGEEEMEDSADLISAAEERIKAATESKDKLTQREKDVMDVIKKNRARVVADIEKGEADLVTEDEALAQSDADTKTTLADLKAKHAKVIGMLDTAVKNKNRDQIDALATAQEAIRKQMKDLRKSQKDRVKQRDEMAKALEAKRGTLASVDEIVSGFGETIPLQHDNLQDVMDEAFKIIQRQRIPKGREEEVKNWIRQQVEKAKSIEEANAWLNEIRDKSSRLLAFDSTDDTGKPPDDDGTPPGGKSPLIGEDGKLSDEAIDTIRLIDDPLNRAGTTMELKPFYDELVKIRNNRKVYASLTDPDKLRIREAIKKYEPLLAEERRKQRLNKKLESLVDIYTGNKSSTEIFPSRSKSKDGTLKLGLDGKDLIQEVQTWAREPDARIPNDIKAKIEKTYNELKALYESDVYKKFSDKSQETIKNTIKYYEDSIKIKAEIAKATTPTRPKFEEGLVPEQVLEAADYVLNNERPDKDSLDFELWEKYGRTLRDYEHAMDQVTHVGGGLVERVEVHGLNEEQKNWILSAIVKHSEGRNLTEEQRNAAWKLGQAKMASEENKGFQKQLEALMNDEKKWDLLAESNKDEVRRALDHYKSITESGWVGITNDLLKPYLPAKLNREAQELYDATSFPKGARRATRIKNELEALRNDETKWNELHPHAQSFAESAINRYNEIMREQEDAAKAEEAKKVAVPKNIKDYLSWIFSVDEISSEKDRLKGSRFLREAAKFFEGKVDEDISMFDMLSPKDQKLYVDAIDRWANISQKKQQGRARNTSYTEKTEEAMAAIDELARGPGPDADMRTVKAKARVIKDYLDNAKLESLPQDEKAKVDKAIQQLDEMGVDINNISKKVERTKAKAKTRTKTKTDDPLKTKETLTDDDIEEILSDVDTGRGTVFESESGRVDTVDDFREDHMEDLYGDDVLYMKGSRREDSVANADEVVNIKNNRDGLDDFDANNEADHKHARYP